MLLQRQYLSSCASFLKEVPQVPEEKIPLLIQRVFYCGWATTGVEVQILDAENGLVFSRP